MPSERAVGLIGRGGPALAPLCVLAVAGVAAVAGAPVVWLVASLVAVALALGRGWRVCLEWLPAAAVLLLATTIVAPLVAGVAGADVFDGSAVPRVLLVLGAAMAVAWAWWLGSDERLRPERSWSEVGLVAAPAALMLALLVVVVSTGTSRLAWFLSGDHLRHLGLTTRTVEAGALEYGMLSYPHGWHAVMAPMWRATGSERDGAGLLALVEMQAAATWVVLVLVPLVLGLTAAVLARARGLGPRLSGLSGLVAGSLVLGPSFYGDYVPRGFDTTLLVLLVIAAAVHVSTVAPTSTAALATAVAATVVTAHSWQVLLVPACLLTAVVLWRRRRSAEGRPALVGDLVTVGVGALASLPGVLAAVSGFGVGAAAEAGDVPPPVIGWFVAVLVAGAVVATRGARGPVATVTVAVAGTFVTSVLLAVVAGVGLSSYYPSKTLWVAAVLGLPAVGVLAGIALSGLGGGSLVSRAGYVVVGTVIGLVVAVSAATPTMGVLRGVWGAADADRVMRMVTSGSGPDAAVVWRASDDVDDATAQLLLDFYSATAKTPRLGLAARTVPEQCALLLAAPAPVVLSNAPESEVRARFACAPGVRVVRVGDVP